MIARWLSDSQTGPDQGWQEELVPGERRIFSKYKRASKKRVGLCKTRAFINDKKYTCWVLTRKMPLITSGLRELEDASEGCKVEEEREVLPGRYPDDLYRTGTEEDER